MIERVVTFFLIACFLMAGVILIITPWVKFGATDWGDNYLLAFVSAKAGIPLLKDAVSSGWVRGAVSGLGVLNIFIAFWELANFNKTVADLQGKDQNQ